MVKLNRKKAQSKVVLDQDELEAEAEKEELDAEIRAVKQMREERSNNTALEKLSQGVQGGSSTHYNKNGLLMANENFVSSKLPFVEVLRVCEYDLTEHDENDDLEREMAFYNQTLLAVKDGRKRLDALGVPTKRPTDYFCEHVKSDGHMNRIKDRLILEEKKIGAFEKRKQQEISRKYQKEISESKRKSKAAADEDDKDEYSSRSNKKGRHDDSSSGGNRRDSGGSTSSSTPSRRKMAMAKTYGSGIKEKMRAKLGDKKSLNDFTEFNPKGGKFVRRGSSGSSSGSHGDSGGKGGDSGSKGKYGGRNRGSTGSSGGGSAKKKGKPNRPGKDARTKRRSGAA